MQTPVASTKVKSIYTCVHVYLCDACAVGSGKRRLCEPAAAPCVSSPLCQCCSVDIARLCLCGVPATWPCGGLRACLHFNTHKGTLWRCHACPGMWGPLCGLHAVHCGCPHWTPGCGHLCDAGVAGVVCGAGLSGHWPHCPPVWTGTVSGQHSAAAQRNRAASALLLKAVRTRQFRGLAVCVCLCSGLSLFRSRLGRQRSFACHQPVCLLGVHTAYHVCHPEHMHGRWPE